MRKFLKRLLFASAVLYSGLWCLQFAVDYGLRRTNVGYYENWNDILEGDINADAIFMGSSRALRHFDPEVFESKTGYSAYNLGGSKLTFDVQKIKYEAYLRNNVLPKIVLINVDLNSLDGNRELYNKTQYLPYYSSKNYNLLKEFDDNITLEYMLPMYKYRGYYETIIDGLKSSLLHKNPHEIHFPKGYAPKDTEWQKLSIERLKAQATLTLQYDEVALRKGLDVITERISKMEANGIKVFLVWTPEYITRQNLEEPSLSMVRVWYEQLAADFENVYFFDFTKDPINLDTTYFYNSFHLNEKGATMFTGWVSDSISKYSK